MDEVVVEGEEEVVVEGEEDVGEAVEEGEVVEEVIFGG